MTDLARFLKEIKGMGEKASLSWPDMLEESPSVEDLDLPRGTVIFVRGDIDSKKLDKEKLDSQKDTLMHCLQKGWKVILAGHRNRPTRADQQAFHSGGEVDSTLLFDPEIRGYLETLTGQAFLYVRRWLNPEGSSLTPDFFGALSELEEGQVLLLENERLWNSLWDELWKAEDESALKKLAEGYETIARQFAEKAKVRAFINDAASDAKNVNFSTVALLPFMQEAVLGFHFRRDLSKIKEARKARLVCFSGSKLDKVKKMKKIIRRGYVETVITGGLVSMPLIKAEAKRRGENIDLGAVERPEQEKRNRELYVSPQVIAQAEEIYQMIEEKNLSVNIVNPVDFKLDDGTVTGDTNVPVDRYAWDIGPKSIEKNHQAVRDYLEEHRTEAADYPVFLNGFLGRMELPDFAAGTRAWSEDMNVLAEAGFKIIAGGGEGRQVYEGAEVIISGGTTIQGMGTGEIPALRAVWLFNHTEA